MISVMKATDKRIGVSMLKKISLAIVVSVISFDSQAQLIAGADGIHITAGTIFAADGLWMAPSSDLEISNTLLTRKSLAISWPELNGIRRVYVFSKPLSFNGLIGLGYLEDELMGNIPERLRLAHSSGNSTDGQHFVVLDGSVVDPMYRRVSHLSADIPELVSLTAVNGRNATTTAGIVASNILSPDGDGINDVWVIENIDQYSNNELQIFDRNGRTLYSEKNYNNTWDGMVNGRLLAEDTYYYILNYDSGAKRLTGFITLVKKE